MIIKLLFRTYDIFLLFYSSCVLTHLFYVLFVSVSVSHDHYMYLQYRLPSMLCYDVAGFYNIL